MANNISINEIEGLIKDGGSMIEYAATFRKNFNTIYDTVDALMETWKGQSGERYLNNVNSFKQDLDDFIKKLDGFGQLYELVGKAYDELEQKM